MNYDLVNTIGNSPLIQLSYLGLDRIYVKLEKTNPAGSIKDRPAYYMLKSAIDAGDLKPGMTVIEPTSGNMGIALAMLGSQLGLKVILVMPDTMSTERRNLIQAYGAELLLTPGAEGMIGAEKKAAELVAAEGFFMPNQFNNPHNPLAHEKNNRCRNYQCFTGCCRFCRRCRYRRNCYRSRQSFEKTQSGHQNMGNGTG